MTNENISTQQIPNQQVHNKNISIDIPVYIIKIASILHQHGYKAYLVGGALRDTLIGKATQDYDISTNASPQTIQKLFPKALDVGAKFGTVIVPIYNPETRTYSNVEITTMRKEANYQDYRHPTQIQFINSIQEDLKRRDFTINALAVDLTDIKINTNLQKLTTEYSNLFQTIKLNLPLIDLFNGIQDLHNHIIRAVGDPYERLLEDPVRAIRACRFAAQLNYKIEPKTQHAIKKIAPYIKKISQERIQSELVKLLKQADTPSIAFKCLDKSGILNIILPELVATKGVKQPIGHIHDVFEHTLAALDKAPKNVIVRLATLFHDIAKPYTKLPDGHFYGHDIKGAELTYRILKRLKFSNQIIEKVTTLVRWHMFHYQPDIWTDAAVRRFIKKVGLNNLQDLFTLRLADARSNPEQPDPTDNLKAFKKHIERVRKQDLILNKKDLAINGKILMQELNLQPGPQIGELLNKLLDYVIEDPKRNNQKDLLKYAKTLISINKN